MKEIITLLFWGLFPFLLTSLSAQTLTGVWYAELPQAEAPARAVLRIMDQSGAWHATIDLPEQEKIGLAAENLAFSGGSLSFEIPGEKAAFTGFVDPSSSFIEGIFTQEGRNLPARFQRKMIPAPKGSPSWIRERLDKKEVMVPMRTPYNAVQVQSSWFPLVDRNPQTFVDIYHCGEEDFQKATHKVFSGSKIEVKVLNQN